MRWRGMEQVRESYRRKGNWESKRTESEGVSEWTRIERDLGGEKELDDKELVIEQGFKWKEMSSEECKVRSLGINSDWKVWNKKELRGRELEVSQD